MIVPASIADKVWGTTELIHSGPNIEIHRLCINKGGYCSEHKHTSKYNKFYIESGELLIRRFGTHGPVLTTLTPGVDNIVGLVIPPGTIHQFEAIEPTIAYEIYWAEVQEDIERRTQGGMR